VAESYLCAEELWTIRADATVLSAAKYLFDRGIPVAENIGDHYVFCAFETAPLEAVLCMIFGRDGIIYEEREEMYIVPLVDLDLLPPGHSDFLWDIFEEIVPVWLPVHFLVYGNTFSMGLYYGDAPWDLEESHIYFYEVYIAAQRIKKGGEEAA